MSEGPVKPMSLPGIEEFSKMLRTMFINIGFFAATLLAIPSIASQFTRSAIVIDPIAVPAAMVTQGLTPEVVANRIWDGLQEFAATASANRETIAAIPDSQLIEFSLPDAGISIDSIFAQIRQFFQIYETRISGEYVCATADCAPEGMQLRLRVVRQSSDVIDLPAMGASSERDYYREAAAGIYAIIDPYVAIAAQAESAPLKAATLARGLILEGSKDAKWAHNLVGDIELNGGDATTARLEYEAALAIDPDFHTARAGLAKALLVSGDNEGALSQLADLERRSPGNVLVPVGRAQVAMVGGNTTEAVTQLKLATEADPINPNYLTTAGKLELEAGNFDAGVAHLNEALAIDPSFGGALDLLADAQWQAGNQEASETLYRQWLAFEPDNAQARGQLGIVLQAQQKYDEALAELQLAYNAGERGMVEVMRATTFFSLHRYDEAAAAFEALAASEPANAQYTTLLGKARELLGERQNAIATYDRYLAAAPADDPARAGIEAKRATLIKTP